MTTMKSVKHQQQSSKTKTSTRRKRTLRNTIRSRKLTSKQRKHQTKRRNRLNKGGQRIFSRHYWTLDTTHWIKTDAKVDVNNIKAVGIFKTPIINGLCSVRKLFCIVKNTNDHLYYIYYKSVPWNLIWLMTKIITKATKYVGGGIVAVISALCATIGVASTMGHLSLHAYMGLGLVASSSLFFYIGPILLALMAIYGLTKHVRHKYVNTGTTTTSINAIKTSNKISDIGKNEIRTLFTSYKQNEFCNWYAQSKIGYNSIKIFLEDDHNHTNRFTGENSNLHRLSKDFFHT